MTFRSTQLQYVSLGWDSQQIEAYFTNCKQQVTLRCGKGLEDILDCRHISLEYDDIVDRLLDILDGPFGWNQDDLDNLLAQLSEFILKYSTAVNTLSASMNPLSACLTEMNMSSLLVRSSTALYLAVSLLRSVEGWRMLARSSLAPIGVSVSLSSPYRLSLDFAFCKFWMSSRDTIVARSIVIEPWDGSNRMRKEWDANDRWSSTSTYLRT